MVQAGTEALPPPLTQLGDANLLQVLPGDVGDEIDVLIAVLHQHLVILAEPNHGQPERQVCLGRRRKSSVSERRGFL